MADAQRVQLPANGRSVGNGLFPRDGHRAAALATPSPVGTRSQPHVSRTVHAGSLGLRVLVVEDDAPVRHACAEIARGLGYLVETADSMPAGQLALKRVAVDIVLLDLKLPGGGGFTLLQEIRETQPRAATVVMTAFASVNSAVEAMRTGAGDYLPKPFTVEELTAVLERAAERREAVEESRSLREQLRSGNAAGLLQGQSPAMDKLFRMVSKVAYTNHPVLILGESGTGKEVVARAIHANGPHAAKPFIPVDCGCLMPSMIASELFGHAKGAFPEATGTKIGLLAAAGDGTVFLDEVGDLPLEVQAKLLRALQEKEIRPAGATAPLPLQARILAATNRDLQAMVENGRFRKDLFYRLNVVNIRIPPLRERAGDIPLLATQVLERIGREGGVHYTFSDEAVRLLSEYQWPGNVRELEHVVERACALSSGPVIHLLDLPSPLQEHRYQAEAQPVAISAAADSEYRVVTIMELERQAILKTLQQLNGDKMLAARMLGIGKTTLYRKLKEYGLHEEVPA